MQIPRILLAGASSGSGKTVLTCAILKVLQNRGYQPVSMKCGPDYIDPMFHKKVLQIPTGNLDLYFVGEKMLRQIYLQHAKEADIAVIEGVMGYYDGLALDSWQASSYHIASITKTPVVLIVRCNGMGLTLVSWLQGILQFQKENHIQGIILNGISDMLYPRLKEMLETHITVPILGYLPKLEDLKIESRHLGLFTPEEVENIDVQIEMLAQVVEKCIEIETLIEIAKGAEEIKDTKNIKDIKDVKDTKNIKNTRNAEHLLQEQVYVPQNEKKRSVNIAVAYDKAFCFYYKENLELLESLGAKLIYFSPISDKELPKETEGILLGGGYPELYAKELFQNQTMRESIKNALNQKIPCIAECGGFMYLHEEIILEDGNAYQMVGSISGKVQKENKRKRFGYIELTAKEDNAFQKKGEIFRGHEFHYWDSENCGNAYLARKPVGEKKWECIHVRDTLFAGYPHIYFYSNPAFAEKFIELCGEKR